MLDLEGGLLENGKLEGVTASRSQDLRVSGHGSRVLGFEYYDLI